MASISSKFETNKRAIYKREQQNIRKPTTNIINIYFIHTRTSGVCITFICTFGNKQIACNLRDASALGVKFSYRYHWLSNTHPQQTWRQIFAHAQLNNFCG